MPSLSARPPHGWQGLQHSSSMILASNSAASAAGHAEKPVEQLGRVWSFFTTCCRFMFNYRGTLGCMRQSPVPFGALLFAALGVLAGGAQGECAAYNSCQCHQIQAMGFRQQSRAGPLHMLPAPQHRGLPLPACRCQGNAMQGFLAALCTCIGGALGRHQRPGCRFGQTVAAPAPAGWPASSAGLPTLCLCCPSAAQCNRSLTGCAECTKNSSTCSLCRAGYRLLRAGTCVPCTANCLLCPTGAGVCSMCADGYYRTTTGRCALVGVDRWLAAGVPAAIPAAAPTWHACVVLLALGKPCLLGKVYTPYVSKRKLAAQGPSSVASLALP